MAATKPIGDLPRLIGKQALDGVVTGDESKIRTALGRLHMDELKTLAVDAVILHQYVMAEVAKRGGEADLAAVEARHPLR